MIQLIQWGPQLEVGYPDIDREHQKLVGLMNDLLDTLLAEGGDERVLVETFAGMVAYADEHFSHEETVMVKAGYPDTAAHLAEHDSFRRQIGDFKAKFDAGETMLTLNVMKFLRLWLTDHILTVDRKLAAFLRG